MSPRWRDQVAILLSPRKVALLRRARGGRGRELASAELPVAGGAAADLGPALARLAEALADPAWQRAAARAVVADHPWARYAVVPWPEARLDAAGRLAHARWVLADAYGDAVADWAVTLSDTPPGRAAVACAVPAALRGALQEALAPARLSLVSLQPQLVAAFNAWRRRLPADDAWFVRVDGASFSAVHVHRGAWDRVHLARSTPGWGLELERLQAFGRLIRGSGAAARTFVDAPAWMRRGPAGRAGVEWLDDARADGDGSPELSLLRRMTA